MVTAMNETTLLRGAPLTFAVNALNRSMGQPDLYPFVLSPTAIHKLGFVHALVHPAERAAQLMGARVGG